MNLVTMHRNAHQSHKPWPHRAIVWLLLLAFTVAAATGCVRRRLTVRSNPPGALVYVDNQQIGTTPCAVNFTYYGTREIRLVKPGYETLTVNQPIPTPWYEVPPLDFVSDNLVPTKIRDNRTASFNLEPQVIVPTQAIIDRGNELRKRTWQGTAMPGPPLTGTPPTGIISSPPLVLPATPPPTIVSPPVTPPSTGVLPPPNTAPLLTPPPTMFGPPPITPPDRERRIVSPPLN